MRSKRLVVPLLALVVAGLLGASTSLAAPPDRKNSSRPARTVIIRRVHVHPYWYRHYWYDPFWYPHSAYVYREETMGTLKVEVRPKGGSKARLYISGALADEFKSKQKVKLKPGQYSVRVHKPGYESQSRTVYMTAGKTLKLKFQLESAG